MKRIALALTLVLGGLVPAARATPMSWKFYATTFKDGGAVTGSFDFDAPISSVSNVDVLTTSGTAFGGASYTVVTPNYTSGPSALYFVTSDLADYTGSTLLFVNTYFPLTDGGGALPSDIAEYQCLDATCSTANPLRTGTGYVTDLPIDTSVPEPSSITLLGLGCAAAALCIRLRL